MQLIAPVTDYIPASILTTRGDIIQRGAAQPERLPAGVFGMGYRSSGIGALLANLQLAGADGTYLKGTGMGANPNYRSLALRDTGVYIGWHTHSAGGADVITGVGFQASAVIFIVVDAVASNNNWSIGFDNGAVAIAMGRTSNGTLTTRYQNKSIYIFRDGGNYLEGVITAIGSDGFTITWSLAGACNVYCHYICLP